MRFFGKSHKSLTWLLLSLVIFVPRLLNLGVFLTPDEPLFLDHAQAFGQAFATGDFRLTTGIGYPGVTVAAWAAPLINLADTEMGQYTMGRIATATLTGLLLLLLYSLARRLLGNGPALIAVVLLALDPYFLSYSRLFHIAAPLTMLMTLAGVALLLWLQTDRRRYLIFAGCFTGLALLTKSTALLLVPMLGIVILSWAIVSGQWRDPGWWGRKLVGLLFLTLISSVLFFALWPAMWVDPLGTLSLTFGKLFTDQEAGTGNLGLFWFGQFVEDPGPLFYPVAFLLKSTPWLLVGLALSVYYGVSGQRSQPLAVSSQPLASRKASSLPLLHSSFFILHSVTLWLFALTYLIIMTIASKKSIRYMLPAFPTFYLLTGLAFYRAYLKLRQIKFFNQHFKPSTHLPTPPTNHPITQPSNHPISPSPHLPVSSLQSPISNLPISLLLLTIILGLTLSLPYHPYYLTYYNPLLLGWRWAPQTLLVGWGEGLDGAARYLNEQPVPTVSAWYEWLFPLLYHGEVESVVPQENLITAERSVLYINQVQRDIPSPNIVHYFRTRRQPEYTVHLNGIDYAWVYAGPIAGFQPPASPHIALGGDFGGEVGLLGYDIGSPTPVSGESLIITLHWQVLAIPAQQRFVYVRLVDAQGHIWASTDSPPVMGLWPVERWQPDMFIEDAQELPIPAGTPPGTYRLEVGLYNPDTGETLAASGQPVGQGGGLLLGDVDVGWQPQTEIVIDLPHQTDTDLTDRVQLVGYDAPPPAATTGDLLPIRLIWRDTNTWFNFDDAREKSVGFIWSRAGVTQAEQIDTLPLPVEQWGRGGVLRSQHDIIVPPDLESGHYDLSVRMHDGQQMVGEPFLLGSVDVETLPHEFKLPSSALQPDSAAGFIVPPEQTIRLAGYAYTRTESTLDLKLFWQTDAPVTHRYKVFAQLLDTTNTVIAQSDSVPAGGQRPTTTWLPDEIITDGHRLSLPPNITPDKPYLLITGFYDPATGQRLSLADEDGDALLVSEIDLSQGTE
ncbi:MAG: glycosyltransferase family 39 protein [Anaerolineae bacterium]|nr:glycosyltransferase family 39 protein [Anaerolineae bacterium]